MATPNPASHGYAANNNQYQNHPMDMSGQVQPHNMQPKFSATLWEDEATICYQVEVDGICVARRDG